RRLHREKCGGLRLMAGHKQTPMLCELVDAENLCRGCGRLLHFEEIEYCAECHPPLSIAAEVASKLRHETHKRIRELELAAMEIAAAIRRLERKVEKDERLERYRRRAREAVEDLGTRRRPQDTVVGSAHPHKPRARRARHT